MAICINPNPATDSHFGKYYIADVSQIPERDSADVSKYRNEELRLSTDGALTALSRSGEFEAIKAVIKEDIAKLEKLSYLADDTADEHIISWLKKFYKHLFKYKDYRVIPAGEAQHFRKIFLNTLIVDFHELVIRLDESVKAEDLTNSYLKIKEIYRNLILSIGGCVGGIQTAVSEGLREFRIPYLGQSQTLTALREDIATQVITQHLKAFISAGKLYAGNERHAVNNIKKMYAEKYGFPPPPDIQSGCGFKRKFCDGVDKKLWRALSVFKMTEYIVEQTDAALTAALNAGTKKVDIIHITQPVLDVLAAALDIYAGHKSGILIQKFLTERHSPIVLDELTDWFALELTKETKQTQAGGATPPAKEEKEEKEAKTTKQRDEIRRRISSTLRRSSSVEREDAWPQHLFTAENTDNLDTSLRESAGKYVKLENSLLKVFEIFTDENAGYVLKSNYKHNLWVTVASGLQATIAGDTLQSIPVFRAQLPKAEPDKFFIYTHGVSYFWIEEEGAKKPVTLAAISKIRFADWDEEALLRCFSAAVLTPFTIRELGDFLSLNVLDVSSRRLEDYIQLARDVITGKPETYLPVLMLIDSSAVRNDFINRLIFGLGFARLSMRLLALKVSLNQFGVLESALLYRAFSPADFFEHFKRVHAEGEDNPEWLTAMIFHPAGFPYFRVLYDAGFVNRVNVSGLRLMPSGVKDTYLPCLHTAVLYGAENAVDYILAKRPAITDINERTEEQRLSVLHFAVLAGKYTLALKLINNPDLNVNSLTDDGEHAISTCLDTCTAKATECIKGLVYRKDIDFTALIKRLKKEADDGGRPGRADSQGIKKYDVIVKLLIQRDKLSYFQQFYENGLINRKDGYPVFYIEGLRDPLPYLHAAVAFGATNIVNFLLAVKLPDNILNEQLKTMKFSALHCAIYCEDFRLAHKLITHGKFDVNLLTSQKEHALTMCLNKKSTATDWVIKTLIRCPGTDFDTKLKDGRTLRSVILQSQFQQYYLEVTARS